LIEYPPEPLSGETRIEWERRALNPWRMEMKRKLFARRGPTCERCGERRAIDLDEGIVPRCDMRGLSVKQRRIAFGSCNLFLLCEKCNRESAHDREAAFRRACGRFGEREVRAWYAGIGLKAPDWRFTIGEGD